MQPATIDAYHSAQSEPDRQICDLLRAALDRGLPKAESRIWHAHPVWFLEGNPIAGYSKLKSCVRLMFWSGQTFETPGLTPSGSFKAAEVRYTEPAQVDPGALAQWLSEARDIQWDYKNIVKRKGRLERLK
ncbi:DUF1801 domain-containing protein [Marinovum sp.]|uniref:DUF1801 domain-containing protein n=1 Tax=Marinovum sp. TaxID=2024839 RepID=UPI002B2787C7|nr:DUF1801 domain-containing protein [Marinovum sp.]